MNSFKSPFSPLDYLWLAMLATPLLIFWLYKINENHQIEKRLSGNTTGTYISPKGCLCWSKVNPSVQYTTGNGQTYQHHSKTSISSFRYPIGEKMTVHYNPNDPEDVRVEGLDYYWDAVWGCTFIYGFLAMVFFLARYKPKT